MIIKPTFSDAGTWRPSASQKEKLLSNAGEISALKLSSGGGAAAVAIYDGKSSADVSEANMKWFLDCSTTDNDINIFLSPLIFKKGVYAVCQQGWVFNPVVCIAKIGSS